MRYIINTSAAPEHVGGNEKLAAVGQLPACRRRRRIRRRGARARHRGDDRRARRSAHRDEHAGRQSAAAPEAAWPMDTFFDDFHKLSEYVNGEP